MWQEWLQFEGNVGKINNIWNVIEKRQLQQGIPISDEKQALIVIDRYKFMDLYPCNLDELKTLGYQAPVVSYDVTINLASSANIEVKTTKAVSPTGTTKKELPEVKPIYTFNPFNKQNIKRSYFPAPDPTKMTSFKPITNALCNLQPIPGGGPLLLPSIFLDFVKRLPPPHYFNVNSFFAFFDQAFY